jgi:hypothetical protein
MDISEIVKQLVSALTRYAYYNSYDDDEARRDRDEIAAEIQQYESQLHAFTEQAEEDRTRVAMLEAAVRDLWRKVPEYKIRELDPATVVAVNRAYGPLATIDAAGRRGRVGEAVSVRESGTPTNPCHCACHVYPGIYPTTPQRPCAMCGHVNAEGWTSGWNGRDGWVRDNAPPKEGTP